MTQISGAVILTGTVEYGEVTGLTIMARSLKNIWMRKISCV